MGNSLSKIVKHSAVDGAVSAVINEIKKEYAFRKSVILKSVYKFKSKIITPHEDRFPPQAIDLEYKLIRT